MGRVFSWDDIVRGRVPQESDFPYMAQHVKTALEDAPGIVGGILCGSILYGNHTSRSDIDCVVVYDPTRWREVRSLLQYLRSAAANRYVPMEFIPIDASIAPTPLHSLGPSFGAHLQYAASHGGLIKKHLLDSFSYAHTNDREDARGYIRNKIRRFEKCVVEIPLMTESELCRFFQKILEVATHIARKMLWLNRVPLLDDSKPEVIKHYPRISTPREYELFLGLLRTDDSYTAELACQLHRIDPTGYTYVIEEIQSRVENALEFAKLNGLRLA